MKNIICFIFIFSLFFVSCGDMETVIDLDVPDHDPVLVLNGVLDTDTNVQLVVSHSVGAFSNLAPSFIHNANVLLYKNDQFVDSLFADMNNIVKFYYLLSDYTIDSLPMYYYKSDYVPEKNATYRVEVNHADYEPISAETYIPNDILLYNINIDTISDQNKISFSFSFNDDANTQNYYRLKLFSSCIKEWEDEEYEVNTDFLSNDPSFPGGIPFEGYTFQGNNVVFSDALFDGQQKNITIDIDTDIEYMYCDTIMISFSNFSNDTYTYYNSLGEHVDKGEAGVFGGEVIPVYSNVNNGLGVIISTNSQNFYLKQ